MTRKDTIIAAVLVNAGLLIVLFASALKSTGVEQEYSAGSIQSAETVVEKVAVQESKEIRTSHGDEVDQVLKQYAMPALAGGGSTLPAQTPVEPSFAEDLRAITLPEVPVQTTPAPLARQVISTPAPAVTDYKVKKGDVLEKIARHHHCSVSEIMKLNNLASANLRIGQNLKLPHKTSSAPGLAKVEPTADGTVKYYTVKNGDNPWTIAVKNHMKVEELLKLNGLDQEKARKLKPGDQLRIN